MAVINGWSSKNGYKFYIEVYESLPGDYIANNYSTISWYLKIQNQGKRFDSSHWTVSVDMDGANRHWANEQHINSTTVDRWSAITIASGSFNCSHNSDGSKTFNVSASLNKNNPGSYDPGNCGLSGTFTVTTIPRASSFTFSGNTIGSDMTINISRHSNSFTHKLWYHLPNQGWQVIADNVATSQTFKIPIDQCSWIPDAGNDTLSIALQTKNGGTNIGEEVRNSYTVYVPESVKPSASISLSEGDAKMSSLKWGVFVKGKSKLTYNISGTGIYGSSIKSYLATIENVKYTKNSGTSNTLTNSGSQTITYNVTDSREHTSTTNSKAYTVVDYNIPAITTAIVTRCTSSGAINDDGERVKYSFTASISPVNNKNAKLFRLGYKLKTASSYTYKTIANNVYSIDKKDIILPETFKNTLSYDFIFEAVDSFSTTSINRTIGTGFDIVNVNKSGRSIALGKISEATDSEKKIELGVDTYYKGTLLDEMDSTPIGTIVSYGALSIPSGWLLCDGRAVSRTAYKNLFDIIGTKYGAGDGSTTFNLPNKKGRVSVGYDSSQTEFNSLGKKGGNKNMQSHTHTGTTNNDGAHKHLAYIYNGNSQGSGHDRIGSTGWDAHWQTNQWYIEADNLSKHSHNFTTNSTGSGNSQNLQPYEVDVYIIKCGRSQQVPINTKAEVVGSYNDSSVNVYNCEYINTMYKTYNNIFKKAVEHSKKIPVGEFVLFEGEVSFVSNNNWQWLADYYAVKPSLLAQYPLTPGYKRRYTLCMDYTDNINKENKYIFIRWMWGSEWYHEFLFGNTWGDSASRVRKTTELPLDEAWFPKHHLSITTTPNFDIGTGYTWRIYKLYIRVFDEIIE